MRVERIEIEAISRAVTAIERETERIRRILALTIEVGELEIQRDDLCCECDEHGWSEEDRDRLAALNEEIGRAYAEAFELRGPSTGQVIP